MKQQIFLFYKVNEHVMNWNSHDFGYRLELKMHVFMCACDIKVSSQLQMTI